MVCILYISRLIICPVFFLLATESSDNLQAPGLYWGMKNENFPHRIFLKWLKSYFLH